ncbi:hypothetical protein [Pseudomonas sp.]|uniref:hypothetical protein n=1 Tax=Pseudomonas sp. TaxID=306 RepID=UPI003D14AF58
MSDIVALLRMNFMLGVKEKVDAKYEEIKPSFTNAELSKLIYKRQLTSSDEELKAAHIQSIKRQLDKIYSQGSPNLDGIFLEFSKSITLFDELTKALQIEGGTYGDNFIASRDFYLSAVRSFAAYVPIFYQGDMEFACIPLKLRLAIEVYFKNMIGYIASTQEFLSGKKIGNVAPYPLSIADLLRFFSDMRYSKYCKLPIDIDILKNINFWSNNLVHTGVISFAWQNLEAVELLEPLFRAAHEDGRSHLKGFNYLSAGFALSDLEKDLNEFLSNKSRKVSVKLSLPLNKPIEGEFYYPRKGG